MLITEEGTCKIEETPQEWRIRNREKGEMSNTDEYDFGIKVYIIYKEGEFENKSVSPVWLMKGTYKGYY